MLSVSSVTSVGRLFQRDGPVVAKLRGPNVFSLERGTTSFPGHDLLCFAVDGVQDCPTCAPASRIDILVPCHADICRPEGQV